MLQDFDAVMARAREGDGAAFQQLYEDLAGPVASYLRHRGAWEVQDLTSEVFLAAFTSLDRFAGGQGEFRSWVFTIAHRRLVDEWRRSGRSPQQVPYEPDADLRSSTSAEVEAIEQLGERRVRQLLAQLSPDQHEVLLLRILGDLTVEQVAALVDKRVGAVKALQRRGLAALRRILESEGVPL